MAAFKVYNLATTSWIEYLLKPAIHTHLGNAITDANPPYYIVGTGTIAGTWLGSHSGITSYYVGLRIDYQLNIDGASTTTLNINGLGAKTCYRAAASKLTTHMGVNSIIPLVYSALNGGCFMIVGDTYDSNESYTVRWNSSITVGRVVVGDTTMNYGTKGYHLLMEGIDGKFYAVTSGGDGASTSNKITDAQLKLGGTILYYGTSTDIATDGTATNIFEGIYSGEMEHWSNKASGWATSYRPFYIVGTIHTSGYLELEGKGTVGSGFITQTLPTTDDGKVYIQIGFMNNTYDLFRLQTVHPIYEYKYGKIRLYQQSVESSLHNVWGYDPEIQQLIINTGDSGIEWAPKNSILSEMSTIEAETGTATTLRMMRADYLKTMIEYRANNMIPNNANGGNLGGTYYSAKQTLSISVGATRWCHLASFNSRSSGKIMYELTGTDVEEFGIIEFKTSYYTDLCQLTISRQSYNPKIRTVAIYGNNGSVKNIYLEVDAGTYARYLSWRVLDSSDAIVNIYNAVSSPAGVYTTGDPVILTAGYVGNIRISSERDVALPSVEKTADYGIEVNDAGKTFHMNATITKAFFINTNANAPFPIGTELHFARYGTGDVEIYPDTGVTILSESSKRKINARYQVVTIKKLDTNTWLLFGALKT